MKNLLLLTLLIVTGVALRPESKVYLQNQAGEIKFFSSAPLEDILALNHKSSALLKTQDGSLTIKVPIRAFEFEKDLMYEHFLEKKYMWAEEHPEAEFKGSITNVGDIDFSENGTYDANVKGSLTIRGVSKDYEVPGKVTVEGSTIKCDAVFNVNLEDHEVPIPKMVIENIAETVEVTVNLEMSEYTK